MSFAHPAIAWAAALSVALPIVIHLLFRRRRMPLDWAAMELLREAVRRTNRRTKLEQWIVLALRCLALLAVGLAIAVPMLDSEMARADARRLVVIVVDNGPTSASRIGSESELVRVIDEVRAMLAERTVRDRVAIVTAAKPVAVVLAPTSDTAAIEQALARIEPSETPSALKDAIALAGLTLDSEQASTGASAASGEGARIIVASAFRQSSLLDGTALAEPRTGTEVIALVPASDAVPDARVASVEARPAPAGDAVLVRATIARSGSSLESGRTTVRAGATGMSKPPARTIAWERGQSDATVDFQMAPAGLAPSVRRIGVTVSIDDDALAIGNTGFVAVDVRRDLEVGVVGRRTSLDAADIERVPASLWVARALSPGAGSGMRVRDIDPSTCDERALLGLDAVVLARPDLVSPDACEAIGAFVRAGGVVLVLPAGESLSQSWAQSVFGKLGVGLRVAAEAIERTPPLRLAEEQPGSALLAAVQPELEALVAPVESIRTVEITGCTKGEVILAFADGSPFMVASAPKRDDGADTRGLVVVLASAPELTWTNLPVKPLMVPLMQETMRAGVQIAAGSNEVAVGEILRGEPNATMRSEQGSSISLGADGASSEVVRRSGLWSSDAGAVVAANVRAGSIALAANPIEVVRSALSPLGDVRFNRSEAGDTQDSASTTGGADWAFMLLVAALAMLLVEGVLSRLFSHASLRTTEPVRGAISIVGSVRARPEALVGGGRN